MAIILAMPRRPVFEVIFDALALDHMDAIGSKYDSLIRRTVEAQLTLFGKYASTAKTVCAAPLLLPLPSRERVGVRVPWGGASPPHPDPLPQWGRGKSSAALFVFFPIKVKLLARRLRDVRY